MTILVTGSTGKVGRSVVSRLLEAGASVRATSRNPQSAGLPADVEVFAADLATPSTFAGALDGVSKVFLFPNPAGAHEFTAVAKAAGVEHIVMLSSQAAADRYAGNDDPIRTMHVVVEQALQESGVDWTFLRPGAFATNTLAWAKSIKEEGVARIPYADANVNPIHEADIAAVAVTALLEDGHRGAVYELTGPESISQRRQVELISAATGREITVVNQGREEAAVELRAQFGSYATDKLIDSMLTMHEEAVGKPADLSPDVEKILGRPARSFAEWAVDHKADFTP